MPVYDPWGWLVWGRELAGLDLARRAGPVVEATAGAVDAPLSLLGDGSAEGLALRRPRRLAARAGPRRPAGGAARRSASRALALAGGALAAASVALTGDTFTPPLRQFTGGLSEPLRPRSSSARSGWRSTGAARRPLARRRRLAAAPRVLAVPRALGWRGAAARPGLRPAGDRRRAADPARLVRPRPARCGQPARGLGDRPSGRPRARRGARGRRAGPGCAARRDLGRHRPACSRECRREPTRARRDPAAGGRRLGRGGRGDGGGRLRRLAALPRPGHRRLRRRRRGGARPRRGAVLRRGDRPRLLAVAAVALLAAVAGFGLRAADVPGRPRGPCAAQADRRTISSTLADRVGDERLLSCGGRRPRHPAARPDRARLELTSADRIDAGPSPPAVRGRAHSQALTAGTSSPVSAPGGRRSSPAEQLRSASSTSGPAIAGVSGAAR